MFKKICLLISLITLTITTEAAEPYTGTETEIVSKILKNKVNHPYLTNPKEEVILWDKTRVDILTDDYAIEVDRAPKWGEAIGQALYYSTVTNKRPGVILLVEDFDTESKYVYRLQTVAARENIAVWIVRIK